MRQASAKLVTVLNASPVQVVGRSLERVALVFFPGNADYHLAPDPLAVSTAIGWEIDTAATPIVFQREEVGDVVTWAWNAQADADVAILVIEVFDYGVNMA